MIDTIEDTEDRAIEEYSGKWKALHFHVNGSSKLGDIVHASEADINKAGLHFYQDSEDRINARARAGRKLMIYYGWEDGTEWDFETEYSHFIAVPVG